MDQHLSATSGYTVEAAVARSLYKDCMESVVLSHPGGSRVEIALFGAHPLSLTCADELEILFMSPASNLNEIDPVRGGIPNCFPRFGADDPALPLHGFLRTQKAMLSHSGRTKDGNPSVTFTITHNEETVELWPNRFAYEISYTLLPRGLQTALAVTNLNEDKPFDFQSAFHTYLEVEDASAVKISGLQGLEYLDKMLSGERVMRVDEDELLRFADYTDRVYKDAPAQLRLRTPNRSILVHQEGLPDAVAWCALGCKDFPDLPRDVQKSYCCLERGAIFSFVNLVPGEIWRCLQRITVE